MEFRYYIKTAKIPNLNFVYFPKQKKLVHHIEILKKKVSRKTNKTQPVCFRAF